MRNQKLSKNNNWKGGRFVLRGYVYLRLPSHPHCTKLGYVKRSRLVLEESLGRYLERGEIAHHKNGNTIDDRVENLEIMAWGKHTSLHNKVNKKENKYWLGRKHRKSSRQKISENHADVGGKNNPNYKYGIYSKT